MMAVGNDNGPGRSALERETPEIALEPIEARDVLDGGIRIEGSTDCATVGKGPASLVEAKLLTDNSTGSVKNALQGFQTRLPQKGIREKSSMSEKLAGLD